MGCENARERLCQTLHLGYAALPLASAMRLVGGVRI